MDSETTLVPHKDRRVGLIIFGVMTIGLGLIAVLMTLLVLAAPIIAAHQPGSVPPPTARQLILPAVMYGVIAVAFIWLGIGSILTRRWARALLLVASTSWFVCGVIAIVSLMLFWPVVTASIERAQPPGQAAMPESAKLAAKVAVGVILGVVYFLLPGTWMLFYRSRQVKATCEARDPHVRWTDSCPLPVLAVSLWFAFSAITMLLMPFVYHGALPVFGVIVSGVAGTVIYLIIGLISAYLARGFYRLDPMAWWIAITMLLGWALSAIITYQRMSVSSLLGAMGYNSAQLQQTGVMSMSATTLTLLCVLMLVPMMGYMLYLRKFFRGATPVAS